MKEVKYKFGISASTSKVVVGIGIGFYFGDKFDQEKYFYVDFLFFSVVIGKLEVVD